MFKTATSFLQGGQPFKVAIVQVCQKVATLKSAATAIRGVRAATCVIRTILTGGKEGPHEA